MMKLIILILTIVCGFLVKECFCLKNSRDVINSIPLQSLRDVRHKTIRVKKTLFNETSMKDFMYTIPANLSQLNPSGLLPTEVDCFGLKKTIASALEWFFSSKSNESDALDVRFFLSSRKQLQRVKVFLGDQFGLEWTDFRTERRTVIIVHGFLSHSNETWISNMEKAWFLLDDVNVVVVDWSAGSNTFNYYKAATNTEIVGYQISKFIEHIINATDTGRSGRNKYGPLHLIGHSLGAHICGFVAKDLKKKRAKWTVRRITGLDPAQPCFQTKNPALHLHKNDAPFVDVIHTNGRLLIKLGLGLPEALGHVDFYPNGGRTQPGCKWDKSSYFNYLPIPTDAIHEIICSHGRSHEYFTESIVSAAMHNCSFPAHRWDLTYRNFLQIINQPCQRFTCTEMGVRSELHRLRGTFFVITNDNSPFCAVNTTNIEELKRQLEVDYQGETED